MEELIWLSPRPSSWIKEVGPPAREGEEGREMEKRGRRKRGGEGRERKEGEGKGNDGFASVKIKSRVRP